MESFFKDLKVIELANVLAGPAVGMFFSELGAEVIKIENKLTNGDVTRSWKLASEDKTSNTSAYYASVNWNKKSIFLDLTNADDYTQAIELIKDADILLSNYKPGDDVKLKVDYEIIKKIKPEIIYAHLTGFGEDNSRTAYDIVLQAETGYMYMNGYATDKPLKIPVALIDVLAAHQLKEAILIALIKKSKTGNGSKVSVSLYDTAIASLSNQASNWLMAQHNPQPMGSLHPNIAPYGEIITTSDNKQIVLAIGNGKQFKKLCTILNATSILNNPLFASNSDRVKNRIALLESLQNNAQNYHSAQLMVDFIQNDVPAGLIQSVKEVFENINSKSLILEGSINPNEKIKIVKTAVFKIS